MKKQFLLFHSEQLRLYFPLLSVVVPDDAPWVITLTPGRGVPSSADVTVPEIVVFLRL